MDPQQQLSVDELFKTIGELTVQLRVANQAIMQLQQRITLSVEYTLIIKCIMSNYVVHLRQDTVLNYKKKLLLI